jgi:general secretion pathway protein F
MKYHFEAFDGAGNLVEGDVEAATVEEARELIWSRGATPYAVRSSQPADILFRDIRFDRRGRRPSDAQLARLARDLGVLLQAGVPLDAALRIAGATSEDHRTRDIALKLLDGVLQGATLGEVMDAAGDTFRKEYVSIVQAGDRSADLAGAMLDLADLLDRRVEIRSRIRGAMTYPVLLVGLAVVALWIVLGLLVPAVTPIFVENGRPLPAILAALDSVRQQGFWIFAIAASCLALLVLGLIAARRNAALRMKLDKAYLAIPVIGRISAWREAARFTRTMATLIRAGVPPLQALQDASPLVRNSFTSGRLERAIAEVREGSTIGAAMARFSALPAVAQQMITVGEESGRLQDMLLRAALILDRQEQTRTTQALAVLTPAITILVAGMVAAIILSVMNAILSLNELALL